MASVGQYGPIGSRSEEVAKGAACSTDSADSVTHLQATAPARCKVWPGCCRGAAPAFVQLTSTGTSADEALRGGRVMRRSALGVLNPYLAVVSSASAE